MVTSELSAPTQALIREELAANIRAARARNRLEQRDVEAGMRDLGFSQWNRGVMGKIERGQRSLRAEEIYALATVLGTSVAMLMSIYRRPA